MSLRVADTLEIRRWIRGYGPDVEVVEPASIRESLRDQAETLVKKLAPKRMVLAGAGSQTRSRRRRLAFLH